MNYTIREILADDYYNNYLEVLNQLSNIDKNIITYDKFSHFIKNLNNNHKIFVLINLNNMKVIGTITLLVEYKLIHNLKSVAHIEDFIIDISYRNLGLGKKLISHVIDYIKNKYDYIYKIILNCNDSNVHFYEKCGFVKKSNQMAMYLL